MLIYLRGRRDFCICHSIHQTIANHRTGNNPGKGISLNLRHNNPGVFHLISQVSGASPRLNGKDSNRLNHYNLIQAISSRLGRSGRSSKQGCIHSNNISNRP